LCREAQLREPQFCPVTLGPKTASTNASPRGAYRALVQILPGLDWNLLGRFP
jgi:hypothetical protein